MSQHRVSDLGVPETGAAPSTPDGEGAAISRLADDLLPALIARLGASGLGEIEVRRAGWKVRLRNPVHQTLSAPARLDGPRTARPLPGHVLRGAGLGSHATIPGSGATRSGQAASDAAGASSRASNETQATVGGGAGDPAGSAAAPSVAAASSAGRPHHVMATSPAVGYYQARREQPVGSRVRVGDRIGYVEVLGVRQDVLAPVDGVIGVSLVQAGEAVEYGQELTRIELPAAPAPRTAGDGDDSSTATAPERIESIGGRRGPAGAAAAASSASAAAVASPAGATAGASSAALPDSADRPASIGTASRQDPT